MLNILIADDDVGDRKTVRRALRRAGLDCETSEAESVAAAVEACGRRSFDCAVIDHHMPGQTGLDGISALRERAPHMAIIMATGQGDEMVASEAIKRGASDYIAKASISPELLRQTIERALEKSSLQKRIQGQREELKDQKAALERANKELLRSNAELRDFAYIASHDLREPIRAASQHASMLLALHGDELSEEICDRLRRICALTERMAHLTASLLEYSRLDVDAKTELVDTHRLVSEIRQDLAELIRENNVEIIVADDLPRAAGNPAQLRIVLQNLITNGIKYNTRDAKRIEIGWAPHAAPEAPGDVRFFVRDNGVGVDPQHHQAVFKIFKRLNTDDAFGAGTGVGLTFAKRVVESLGGEIWLESEPGSGATFFFTNAGARHETLA